MMFCLSTPSLQFHWPSERTFSNSKRLRVRLIRWIRTRSPHRSGNLLLWSATECRNWPTPSSPVASALSSPLSPRASTVHGRSRSGGFGASHVSVLVTALNGVSIVYIDNVRFVNLCPGLAFEDVVAFYELCAMGGFPAQ